MRAMTTAETTKAEKKMQEALQEAKDKLGGNTALARAINDDPKTKRLITPQAISQWVIVPTERVVDVERVTGVSRHRLRPDIFGAD
jgi:DNA-binding transcriptional regulator YdaS (Cro superfamily)